MKKLLYIIGIFATLSTLLLSGCDDEDTYADMKEKEKSAISRFIKDNEYCGPIKVISEEEFGILTKIRDNYFKMVLSMDEETKVNKGGIINYPAAKFLVQA